MKVKQDEVRQICPLTPEEQKKMEKIFDAMFREDDCRD